MLVQQDMLKQWDNIFSWGSISGGPRFFPGGLGVIDPEGVRSRSDALPSWWRRDAVMYRSYGIPVMQDDYMDVVG